MITRTALRHPGAVAPASAAAPAAGPRDRPTSPSRLVRNALWLLGSTAATSLFGLVFWSVAARMYSVTQIGNATSLITAVSLLAYLSLFGLNGSLVKFLPGAVHPDRQVSAALSIAGGAGLVLGVGYVILLPVIAPRTAHAFRGPALWLLFAVIVVAAAVNLATDSVFIAYRAAHWNPVVDGLVQGGTKLLPLVALAAAGTVGIVTAYGAGSIAAAACSVWLISWRLGLRLRPTRRLGALDGYLSFSAASYVSSLLNLTPLLLLPLIALDKLGSRSAGYYYIAFQMANMLGAIPFAVCESLFAELAHAPAAFVRLARRSAVVIVVTLVPAVTAVAIAARLVLSLFGPSYVLHATTLLRLLCLGTVPVAVNTWASFLLKSRRHMAWLIWSNVFYVLTAAGLAFSLTPFGLPGIGAAWIAANGVSAVVAVMGLLFTRSVPEHRTEGAMRARH
jgi:O-antigen/teichoic acid export membrane protein